MTKKIEQVQQWTGYQGNKWQLVPLIMSLVPKHTERFVDLFGGTGIVGVNAYRFNRCEKVIYNDLEYDLVKMLEYIHETDPEAVVKAQDELIDACFGTAEKIGEDERDEYHNLLEAYNDSRLMLWDNKRGETDFEFAYDMKISMPGGKDRGEWKLLLFLIRHSYYQTPTPRDSGRLMAMTPRYGKLKRNDPKLKDFATAWHETPVDFYSCDFTTGYLFGKRHERPRPEEDMERFRDMISSLSQQDFVFIDPPYLGSKAAYNSKWGQSMEIYLMAFCQMLAERKVPFLITNNLAWNTSIFTEWRKHFSCYMLAEDAKNLYANKNANNMEVFVTNLYWAPSKYKVHADLERLPKGK